MLHKTLASVFQVIIVKSKAKPVLINWNIRFCKVQADTGLVANLVKFFELTIRRYLVQMQHSFIIVNVHVVYKTFSLPLFCTVDLSDYVEHNDRISWLK